jgi:hypothetical protein
MVNFNRARDLKEPNGAKNSIVKATEGQKRSFDLLYLSALFVLNELQPSGYHAKLKFDQHKQSRNVLIKN